MRISVCHRCYEKGRIVVGKFINTVYPGYGVSYVVYHCPECKESYKE